MSETNCSTRGSRETTSWNWRLGVFIAGVLAAIALVAWINTGTWKRLEELRTQFAVMESERFLLGLRARESVLRLNASLLRYQLSADPAEQTAFHRTAEELRQQLAILAPALTPEETAVARDFRGALDEYLASTADMIERPLRGIRKDTTAQLHEIIIERSARLVGLAEQLVGAQNKSLTQFFAGGHGAMESLQRLLWLSLIALSGLVVCVAALVFRAFVTPLRRQLTEAQEIAQRQEKLASLGVLAAGVAHEIRNPLTAIKMRLFSLRKSLPEIAADGEDLAVVHSEIHRLERIVKDFLLFARPSEPKRDEVSIFNLLSGVHTLLNAELEKRGIRFDVDADQDIRVRGDREQLQQVLINLAQNAADSIGVDGRIVIEARGSGSELLSDSRAAVTIDVVDSGKGIAPEVEKRLFDPFFSTKEGGTGLGLPIAARIIEKHEGLLQYSSERQRGTTFRIVLPRFIAHESPAAAH